MLFEELDFQQTPLGEISLRRRQEPRLDGALIYEVKLGDEFLMSSLFTEAEIQLARMALDSLSGKELSVVVGGLGLGYTALAALENIAVSTVTVVEVMEAVIDWHRRELVPAGASLNADPRCKFVRADFFTLMASTDAFHSAIPAATVDAILLDIDHSPRHWLNPGNGAFYSRQGLQQVVQKLAPCGVFGLWSNDPPDADFIRLLESEFDSVEARIVTFDNPYSGASSSNTVYLAWPGNAA